MATWLRRSGPAAGPQHGRSTGTGGCSPPGSHKPFNTWGHVQYKFAWRMRASWLVAADSLWHFLQNCHPDLCLMAMSHFLWRCGFGEGTQFAHSKRTILTFSFFGSPKTLWPASSSFRLCSLLPTETLYYTGCMLDQPPNPQCVLIPRVMHELSIGLFLCRDWLTFTMPPLRCLTAILSTGLSACALSIPGPN